MIIVNQNATSSVVVTLNENNTIEGTFSYLWEVVTDSESNPVYFICDDISWNKERFNQFIITMTAGTASPELGIISNLPAGTHRYRVYQQENSTNLDPDSAVSLVESGRIRVKGEDVPAVFYGLTNSTKKYYI